MLFRITLNMPSRKGHAVHQILAEHTSNSLSDLMREFRERGYIIATEYYKDEEGNIAPHGELAICFSVVGKAASIEDEFE